MCLFIQALMEIALLFEDAQIQIPFFYAIMGYLVYYQSFGKYSDSVKCACENK